jgi:hypothetical protein
MEKFAKCTVQTSCLYSGSARLSLSAWGRARGGFLNCADFKFQTETKLKNPETYSIFDEFLDYFKPSGKFW